MGFDQFGIVITNRCTAACKFCGWRCSPKNHGVIDLNMAKDAIDQAVSLGLTRRLGLTGGEAFLYPDLVRDILKYGREKGYKLCSIATNGFWGAWSDEKIDAVLEPLEDCCDLISFSYDSFHAEYIPEESIWHAAESAGRHGIKFHISVADVKGEKGAGPFLASLSEKALKRSYDFYPLQQIGNAMDMPAEMFCRDLTREEVSCKGFGLFTLLYDGRVFPCCNPGIFDTDLYMGNIKETSLKDMLESSDVFKYMRLLCNKDYYRRLIIRAEEAGLINVPEKVVSGCEICHWMFRDKKIADQIYPMLKELYQEMIVHNFLCKKEGE